MMSEETPKGWCVATIGDLAEYINGRAFKPTEWKTSGQPIIRIQNLNDENAPYNYSSDSHEEKYLVYRGDLLFAWSASLGAHIWRGGTAWLNQHIFNVKTNKITSKVFAFYLLNKITAELYAKAHGSGMVHVTKGKFESTEVLLPPLAEQQRIVTKIEELFSELDKGVENLRTAQQQLKVYRQALLKHAFEGKLTADWRAQNPEKLESADALLARIQQKREGRYQQQLQEWENKGKKGSKPKVPKFSPPLTAEELSRLPELPFGWGWSRLGAAFGIYVGATPSRKVPEFWDGHIPWVSSGEVAFCRIKSTKERITELGYVNSSTETHPAGTVMLAMIGEGKTRGQPAILDIEAAHNQNTAAIRVSETGCAPEYVYLYLCLQYEITRMLGSGNNQKALNKERVSGVVLPLCSVSEQKVLNQILDEKLSTLDQLEQTITHSLQQADALRQSILKKAFSGQLVPQDPNDEPASVLLERIRAERVAQPKARGRKAKESA